MWPALLAGTFVSGMACAQTATPPAAAQLAGPPEAPTTRHERSPDLPRPILHVLPPPGDAFTPPPQTGPLARVGEALADRGIYLRQIIVDEFAGNSSGGQGRGSSNSLATAFGGDLDLERLVGIPGAAIHLTMNKSIGTSLAADHTLNGVSFQTRFKSVHNLRLAALVWDQDLFDGVVNISGGRVSALTYFNASNIYCNFQNNSVCFNPAVLPIQDKALSFFPYGTWGGRVKIAPSKRFYVQLGAFEANPALIPSHGFDFSTKTATGVQEAMEIGFQSASPKAEHAYHIRIGGYRNTSDVPDPFLNTHGLPRLSAKGTPLIHKGQSAWYVMGDVVLARMGADRKRNITLFGGSIGTTASYVTYTNQTLAGFVWTGPFASRPEDTLGLVASYIRLGSSQVRFLEASRAAAGGTDPVHHAEGVIELNYGFKLLRGIRLNPNIQYIVDPDNNLKPSATHQSKNILAFGLRLSIEVGPVLGFPVWQ